MSDHFIRKILFDFEWETKAEAQSYFKKMSEGFEQRIEPLLATLLEKHDIEGHTLEFDRIQLDLGVLSSDSWEKDLESALEKALNQFLSNWIQQNQLKQKATTSSIFSKSEIRAFENNQMLEAKFQQEDRTKLDALLFFFNRGFLPDRIPTSPKSLQLLIDEAIDHTPRQLLQQLLTLWKKPYPRTRFLHQTSKLQKQKIADIILNTGTPLDQIPAEILTVLSEFWPTKERHISSDEKTDIPTSVIGENQDTKPTAPEKQKETLDPAKPSNTRVPPQDQAPLQAEESTQLKETNKDQTNKPQKETQPESKREQHDEPQDQGETSTPKSSDLIASAKDQNIEQVEMTPEEPSDTKLKPEESSKTVQESTQEKPTEDVIEKTAPKKEKENEVSISEKTKEKQEVSPLESSEDQVDGQVSKTFTKGESEQEAHEVVTVGEASETPPSPDQSIESEPPSIDVVPEQGQEEKQTTPRDEKPVLPEETQTDLPKSDTNTLHTEPIVEEDDGEEVTERQEIPDLPPSSDAEISELLENILHVLKVGRLPKSIDSIEDWEIYLESGLPHLIEQYKDKLAILLMPAMKKRHLSKAYVSLIKKLAQSYQKASPAILRHPDTQRFNRSLSMRVQMLEDEEDPTSKAKRPPIWATTPSPATNGAKPLPGDEFFFIKNAGAVILWPFLSTYFQRLGLLNEKKKFKSVTEAEVAVHLVEYLATHNSVTPEHLLVFNKVLCGLPLEHPIPKEVTFPEGAKDMGESLLRAVIQQWSALKNTSEDGLRGGFLIRDGRLTKEENNWKIRVDAKPYDLLVERLPWSLNMIRLPWNPYFIYTEWR